MIIPSTSARGFRQIAKTRGALEFSVNPIGSLNGLDGDDFAGTQSNDTPLQLHCCCRSSESAIRRRGCDATGDFVMCRCSQGLQYRPNKDLTKGSSA